MTETPTNDALDTSLDGSNLQDEEFVTEDIVNEDITEVQNPSSPVIPLLDLNNTDVFRKDKLRTPSKRAVPFSVQSPSQELYAKYIRLEQDFKDLQKAFDLIDVLEKSKISDQKLLKKKIVALQDQVASLQDSITTTELNFKQKENNLKREKFALKKTLNQSMTRPNTASALQ
ncbi:predicted protein [Naegleria gruberi]|uniref:Predicted protein n=1 Tax=Naegleria gruberi TaxID=5762 RepID=D2VG94_NAEGR|nr:uncharacterized protein NAEGRDRAFT_79871 [Naegleria gruberi]EFC44310.1 predicted protein [Naegleria gruberi]|eukprot:XP_002677054.1 predicted protein [Naegleria gruberi strain NEG-M]